MGWGKYPRGGTGGLNLVSNFVNGKEVDEMPELKLEAENTFSLPISELLISIFSEYYVVSSGTSPPSRISHRYPEVAFSRCRLTATLEFAAFKILCSVDFLHIPMRSSETKPFLQPQSKIQRSRSL